MSKKGGVRGNDKPTIVIRKEEVVEGGHHGGAWKVAYADFVTAMMAFFLLMWLINATTEAQRRGLADYFSKSNIFSHQMSGSGKPFGGKTPFEDGALVSDRGAAKVTTGTAQVTPEPEDNDSDTEAQARPPHLPGDEVAPDEDASGPGSGRVGAAQSRLDATGTGVAEVRIDERPSSQAAAQDKAQDKASADRAEAMAPFGASEAKAAQLMAEQQARAAARAEHAAFEHAAQAIRDAVRSDPGLASLARQLAIDETPDGLRIQILDEDKKPMFASGSADPNDSARHLLEKIAPVLAGLHEGISVAGYTDAAPYRGTGKSNWDLSTERANATRRQLEEFGLEEARFRSVTGHADRDPLLPGDPLAAANRRIAIVVLREARGGPRRPTATHPDGPAASAKSAPSGAPTTTR